MPLNNMTFKTVPAAENLARELAFAVTPLKAYKNITNWVKHNVVYDHDNGDIKVYKDKNDEDELYMIKEVDGIHVSLIGNNENVMAKMLNSAKLTTTFAY